MSERQYLLQHIVYLASRLSKTASIQERRNVEQAILFYSKELQRLDGKQKETYVQ